METVLEEKVYYSDTDAYGVVWHGSYLRWLEAGRVEFCEALGENLVDLQKNDIVLPVINLHITYKMPSRLNDKIIIKTKIKKFTTLSVIFEQTIYNNNKISIKALVEVVAVNNNGKLYRKIPDILLNKFQEAVND
jgi:acyl-CoA thioester hydrolase